MRPLVLTLAVILAACSQSAENTAAKGDQTKTVAHGTACDLVTASEAATLLDGKVGTAQRDGGSAGYDQCQYLREGERIADQGTLTVQRLPVALADKKKALSDNGDTFEEVTGLGDGAVWVPLNNFLYVAHGNETLMASVARSGIDMKAKSTELAKLALPRM